MLDFLSRVAAINAPMPVIVRAPARVPVPVTDAPETVAYARVAHVTDIATIIEEMGEWCDDVHDVPVSFAIED